MTFGIQVKHLGRIGNTMFSTQNLDSHKHMVILAGGLSRVKKLGVEIRCH
jgi:hypothetical protein